MDETTLHIVHGFAVASPVFRPLIRRLHAASFEASLFRYPSVGLPLSDIVARLCANLRKNRPDALIAHSLGCIATWLAVHETQWHGPIVLLAPPFTTIPSTRLIPRFLRWPFAPLLDHCDLTSNPHFRLPDLVNCHVRTIAGRFDFSVPMSCTHHADVDDSQRALHTHNSMLFATSIATLCSDWVARHQTADEQIED